MISTKIKIIIGAIIGVLSFIGGIILTIFLQGKQDEKAKKITDVNDYIIDNQKQEVKEIVKKENDNEKTDNNLNNKSIKLHNITK